MDSRAALKGCLDWGTMLVTMYLGDLEDADLLVRPIPECNHIAWQLGHLINSENNLVETTLPGSMPPLPAGFAEKHSKETASSDNPADFLTKAEYLKIREEQRVATAAALAKLTDADLDQLPPEQFRTYLKSVGDLFAMLGTHDVMHAGQWAVIRRKLGRPPLF